jgi:hypothetical protein
MRLPARASRSNAETARIARAFRLCVLCGLCVLSLGASACGGATTLFRQYEYEEEVYLSLNGTATVYVNSSLAALNALRGTSFDVGPAARVDKTAVRNYYSGAGVDVRRVTESRRNGRRYVHVRLDVDDLRKLSALAPFAWSTYRFQQDGTQFIYRQTIGPPAGNAAGGNEWTGKEIVAFRLHLPSKIRFHNTRREVRGNILEWEQLLAARLRGEPLVAEPPGAPLEARMDTQSILYRTLLLFGATFVAVAIVFGFVIWWVTRRGSPVPVEPAR